MKIHWNQVLIALLSGLLIGAGVGLWRCHRPFHREGGGEQRFQRMLDRFSSDLKLTPEQKSRAGEIFEANRRKLDALRAETQPKFEALRTSTDAEIRKFLTPEQQEKFDKRHAEMESRWRKTGPPPHP